ncbi:MAG: 30S ribosomal protein S16 [Candidatus Binatia bacterium]|nr:MAG: 30S ribosomal protein S16 [Candidatus Binatia bacterium]
MPTSIRLARHGGKKHPVYRIVVADSRVKRDGRRLDQIGTYDPHFTPARVRIDEEKLRLWLRRGAKPTDTVARLIRRTGLPLEPEGT